MTTIVIFIVTVSIAALLVWSDLRWFALYSFAVVVLLILGGLERLWKFMRVSHFSNAAKTSRFLTEPLAETRPTPCCFKHAQA
jgi:uncharacterized membrane protein YqjE